MVATPGSPEPPLGASEGGVDIQMHVLEGRGIGAPIPGGQVAAGGEGGGGGLGSKEIERLGVLCAHLKESLRGAVAEREAMAEKVRQSEERRKEEVGQLEEEAGRLEVEVEEGSRKAGEEMEEAQKEFWKIGDKAKAAEERAKKMELAANAGRKEVQVGRGTPHPMQSNGMVEEVEVGNRERSCIRDIRDIRESECVER